MSLTHISALVETGEGGASLYRQLWLQDSIRLRGRRRTFLLQLTNWELRFQGHPHPGCHSVSLFSGN